MRSWTRVRRNGAFGARVLKRAKKIQKSPLIFLGFSVQGMVLVKRVVMRSFCFARPRVPE